MPPTTYYIPLRYVHAKTVSVLQSLQALRYTECTGKKYIKRQYVTDVDRSNSAGQGPADNYIC